MSGAPAAPVGAGRGSARRIIVTPTFRPHFAFNREFLDSYREHAADAREVAVHFVVTRDEMDEIRLLLADYPELDLHAHAFEDLLAAEGHVDDPLALLREVGKFTYQSLKKLYALRHLAYDQALVLDSEALVVKPVRMAQVFDDYFADPFVFYSDLSTRGDAWFEGLSDAAVRSASALLRIPYPKKYFLEYYGWLYDRALIDAVFEHFPEGLLAVLRSRNADKLPVFECQLIYSVLLTQPDRFRYRLVSANATLREYLGDAGYAEYMSHFVGGAEQMGVFEMVSRRVNARLTPALERLYNDRHLLFYRFDVANENVGEQRAFIDRTPITFLTSSENFRKQRERIAVCVSGVARQPRQNLKFLKAFLAGADADVFLHFWEHPDRDVIERALAPKASVFQPASEAPAPPAFRRMEKGVDAARAANSTAMFYSVKRANDLKRAYEEEHGFRYDIVVRLRLDFFSTATLAEVIEHIRYEQKGWDRILYVPDMAQSVGLNDQIALGSSETMDVYAGVFDTLADVARSDYFNPEYVLLRHVQRSGLKIRTFPFEYVLLRGDSASTLDLEQHARRTRETWWSAQMPEILPGSLDAYFAAKADSTALVDELDLETPKVYRLRAGARGYVAFDAATRRLGLTADAASAALFYVIIPADGDRTAVNIRPRELVMAAQRAADAAAPAYNLRPEADGSVRADGPGGEDAAFFVGRRDGGLTFEWRPGFWRTVDAPRGAAERPAGGGSRNHREEMVSGQRRVLQPTAEGIAVVPIGSATEAFALEYAPDPEAEAVEMGLDVSPAVPAGAAAEPLPVRLLHLAYLAARAVNARGPRAVRDDAVRYLRRSAHIVERENRPGLKNAIKRQIGKRL